MPEWDGHRLTAILYDKREHRPLSPLFIVSLPHASSQISAHAKYSVVRSQLHRFYHITLCREGFVVRITALLAILPSKGYDSNGHALPRMLAMICRFWQRVGYGLSHQVMISRIEARLHFVLDCMTDRYFTRLYADPERRAKAVVRDTLDGLCLM